MSDLRWLLDNVPEDSIEEHALEIEEAINEHVWMRREIERVGRALFTGTKTGYVGTEEDLHAIGQFVEGLCDVAEEHASLTEKVEIEHEQVCQFIRDMYTGRFAEREKYYWELPQWIRDAIEADPIYNSPSGE